MKLQMNIRLFVVLFVVNLLSFCNTKTGIDKNSLLALLGENSFWIKSYFSYPGRYSDPEKKREVIDTILTIIRNAKFSLKIYAYSLNNPEIIQELKEAKKRGVQIDIVGDKEQNYDLLLENGFVVNLWKQSGLHHLKIIYADNELFFTGTGNFSRHGLTHDWNGYLSFTVESSNRNRMQEFLDEKLNIPVFSTNGIQFISSPENGFLSQNLLLRKIEEAKFTIDYLIFDHFDPIITHALKKASARGVQVTGIYDSPVDIEGQYLANEFYGFTSNIYKDGNEDIIETLRFPEGGLLHHKSMIIDGKILLSGSYNYSTNARDSNREILFLSENINLVSEFHKEFYRIRDRSYSLPKKKIYSFAEQLALLDNSISVDTICLPQNINSPMIEIGSGIWKTYLYYPRLQNTNCIPILSYAPISSGFAKATRSDFQSIESLWDTFQIFDRDSNFSFVHKSEKIDSVFHSGKRTTFKNPWYFSFSSSDIYFEFSEEEESLLGREIQVWIPGKKMLYGKIQKSKEKRFGYSVAIPIPSNERSYVGFFIDTPSVNLFFCFQDRERSGKSAFEFITKQIYLESENRNGESLECVRN